MSIQHAGMAITSKVHNAPCQHAKIWTALNAKMVGKRELHGVATQTANIFDCHFDKVPHGLQVLFWGSRCSWGFVEFSIKAY